MAQLWPGFSWNSLLIFLATDGATMALDSASRTQSATLRPTTLNGCETRVWAILKRGITQPGRGFFQSSFVDGRRYLDWAWKFDKDPPLSDLPPWDAIEQKWKRTPDRWVLRSLLRMSCLLKTPACDIQCRHEKHSTSLLPLLFFCLKQTSAKQNGFAYPRFRSCASVRYVPRTFILGRISWQRSLI